MSTQWTWFVLKKVEQARPVWYFVANLGRTKSCLFVCDFVELLQYKTSPSYYWRFFSFSLAIRWFLLYHRLDLRRCFLLVWGHVTTKLGRAESYELKISYNSILNKMKHNIMSYFWEVIRIWLLKLRLIKIPISNVINVFQKWILYDNLEPLTIC